MSASTRFRLGFATKVMFVTNQHILETLFFSFLFIRTCEGLHSPPRPPILLSSDFRDIFGLARIYFFDPVGKCRGTVCIAVYLSTIFTLPGTFSFALCPSPVFPRSCESKLVFLSTDHIVNAFHFSFTLENEKRKKGCKTTLVGWNELERSINDNALHMYARLCEYICGCLYISSDHEFWTSNIAHSNPLHLLANLISLLSIAVGIESPLTGSINFLWFSLFVFPTLIGLLYCFASALLRVCTGYSLNCVVGLSGVLFAWVTIISRRNRSVSFKCVNDFFFQKKKPPLQITMLNSTNKEKTKRKEILHLRTDLCHKIQQ
jgi:hypothetical protein